MFFYFVKGEWEDLEGLKSYRAALWNEKSAKVKSIKSDHVENLSEKRFHEPSSKTWYPFEEQYCVG